MSVEENKALVRRVVEEIWNQGKVELVDALLAPDYVNHTPAPSFGPDREGYKQFLLSTHRSFPDVHFTVEYMVAEDDVVVFRLTFTGTNTGDNVNFPATGKSAKFPAFEMLRIRDGKVVEEWGVSDFLGMWVQLGLFPAPHRQTATV
ncbi:MAG TPA: ester cyclase [Chloroflexia bacterium]|nr:ester cyclase [Chloroflexia bacterium]